MTKPLMTEAQWNEWSAGVRECVMNPERAQFFHKGRREWMSMAGEPTCFFIDDRYRARPRTIMCNGFEVPAPETEAPECSASFYVPDPSLDSWYSSAAWSNSRQIFLARGLVYLKRYDAIARAKAMAGIDPYAETTEDS